IGAISPALTTRYPLQRNAKKQMANIAKIVNEIVTVSTVSAKLVLLGPAQGDCAILGSLA
ncbi:MAG TPA: hypothetical protein PKD73_18865, partial [Burkholderiaceae bacterium]|nr:hypothetical protein [Burkholderiaceae bacterium]